LVQNRNLLHTFYAKIFLKKIKVTLI